MTRLLNRGGVRRTIGLAAGLPAFLISAGLAIMLLMQPSWPATVLIWSVFALGSVFYAAVAFLKPEVPTAIDLRTDGITVHYFRGYRRLMQGEMSSFEVTHAPLGSALDIRLLSGQTVGLGDLDEEVVLRTAEHMESLGVRREPDRYFWRRAKNT